MSQSPLWVIRPGVEEDRNLVFNSFLRSFREEPAFNSVPNSVYFPRFHKILEGLLNSPNVGFIVACNPEDSNQIFGYAVGELLGETLVLHWVYVKHSFRSVGLGKALTAALVATPGHTQVYRSTRPKRASKTAQGYIYDPFYLWSKCT